MKAYERPWVVDDKTQMLGEILCYSGKEHGRYIWQIDCMVRRGEFFREYNDVPINQARFCLLTATKCLSVEDAREKTVAAAGLRGAIGIKCLGWKTAGQTRPAIVNFLEDYKGYDAFLLSMRDALRVWGSIYESQEKRVLRAMQQAERDRRRFS